MAFIQCPKELGLPPEFSCPETSRCLSLAANTTALCCPAGSDCTIIQSITCDLSLQDVTLNPKNVLKTTSLDSALERCGQRCCPFGYSCNKDQNCRMNAASLQAISPTPTRSRITAASTSTGVVGFSSPFSSSSTSSPTSTPLRPSATGNILPPSAVIGITIAAIILTLSLVLGIAFWHWPKRKRRLSQERFEKAELCGDPVCKQSSIRVELDAREAKAGMSALGLVERAELPATPVIRGNVLDDDCERRRNFI